MNQRNYVEALNKRYRDYLHNYRVTNDPNRDSCGEQVFEEPDHQFKVKYDDFHLRRPTRTYPGKRKSPTSDYQNNRQYCEPGTSSSNRSHNFNETNQQETHANPNQSRYLENERRSNLNSEPENIRRFHQEMPKFCPNPLYVEHKNRNPEISNLASKVGEELRLKIDRAWPKHNLENWGNQSSHNPLDNNSSDDPFDFDASCFAPTVFSPKVKGKARLLKEPNGIERKEPKKISIFDITKNVDCSKSPFFRFDDQCTDRIRNDLS